MKTHQLKVTKLDFSEENLEVLEFDKATAVKVIQELVESLAGTSTGFVSFRAGSRFFVFSVKDDSHEG